MHPPAHPREPDRLAALRAYAILDTPPEDAYDEIARLAARALDVPIALVSLVDADREWFKARVGLDLEQTPRAASLGAHAIGEPPILVVPDALADARFRDNPLVVGPPSIRFYAAAVLTSREGEPLGTLCAIDRAPREMSEAALDSLRLLARRVASELELRRCRLESAETESRLARARASAMAIVDHAPVGIFRAGAGGLWEYVNPRVAAMADRPEAALLGEGWLEAIHPDDRASVAESWKRGLRSGDELQFECRFVAADGGVRWLSGLARPMPATGGGAPGYLGSLWDVSERHQGVEGLRESESRYRLLAEHASDLIARLTPEGRLVYVSPASERLLGYRPEELVGHTVGELDLVHPEDRERVAAAFAELRDAQDHLVVTYRIRRRHGDYATFEVSRRVVRADDGQPLEVVAISREVTHQRALEEQLRLAQRMEAVGRFAGGVAHDFNNLLTVILGHADVLQASLDPDSPEGGDARAIREAGEQASRLTRQLLAYGRRQLLAPILVDLNQVVGEMEEMLSRLLGDATRLVWEPQPELGSVLVDRSQLEQVIMNLAVNARDALGHGGQLTLRTQRLEVSGPLADAGHVPPGDWVLLTVADDGAGMDEATRQRIFEPFFTTKPRERGTGLGLATVYGIVKQSGGFIYVDSEPGSGTSFRIYLPRAEAAAAAPAEAAGEPASGQGGTILLVEDQESIRRVVERYLLARGFRVLSAGDGQEAEALARGEPGVIDLLLTDVVLTDDSGPQLARRIRDLRPGIRVLYTSGYAGHELDEREELDRSGFLQKPFRLQDVAARVREIIDAPPPD